MAINIKEIFDGDSNIIKTEKINYNFDQIVANGGGPIGPKGNQGNAGIVGPTGDKGEKGIDGDKGQKGEQGISLNYWSQIENTNQNLDSYILKPKLEGKTLHPSVFLGDDTWDETTGTSGYGVTDPNAKLTIKKDGYDHHLKLVSAPDPNSIGVTEDLIFRGEYDSNISGSTYHIQGDAVNGILAAPIKVLFTAPFFEVNATDGNYASNIKLNGTNVNILGALQIDDATTFLDNVEVQGATTFSNTGAIKVSAGTTAQRPGTGVNGMFRYNSSLNRFEGYANGAWKSFIKLEDADRSTFISVESDVNQTGSANERIDMVADNQKFISINSSYTDDTTAFDVTTFETSIVVNASDVFLTGQDTGLVFPEGQNESGQGGFTAGNYNTSISKRRLSDYFERATYSPNTPLLNIGSSSQQTISTTHYSGADFKVNYTKIGNLLNVFGQYTFTISNFSSYGNDFGFDLGTTDQFAYTNAFSKPIIVTIEVDYFQMDRGDSSAGADLPYSYFGLIEPGSNVVKMYWRNSAGGIVSPGASLTDGYVSTDVQVDTADLSAYYQTGPGNIPTTIRFNFQMPTDIDSYTSGVAGGPSGS